MILYIFLLAIKGKLGARGAVAYLLSYMLQSLTVTVAAQIKALMYIATHYNLYICYVVQMLIAHA